MQGSEGKEEVGNWDDGYQGCGVPRETSKGMDPQPP